ncbi:hypothetical protein CRG98_010919, partial [Punica granatum]
IQKHDNPHRFLQDVQLSQVYAWSHKRELTGAGSAEVKLHGGEKREREGRRQSVSGSEVGDLSSAAGEGCAG